MFGEEEREKKESEHCFFVSCQKGKRRKKCHRVEIFFFLLVNLPVKKYALRRRRREKHFSH